MGLGERLTALRIAAGLSQNELARRSGVPQTYISLLARGVNENPGAETAIKLADALHTSLDYLLTGRKTPSGAGWTGDERRQTLPEAYRAMMQDAADLDEQTLRWLDKQFASFVHEVAQERRRTKKMVERSALAPTGTDGAAPIVDSAVKKVYLALHLAQAR